MDKIFYFLVFIFLAVDAFAGRGDQGVRRQRATLIGPQHLALPFAALAVRAD